MATNSKLIGDLDNEIDHIYVDNLMSQSELFENDGACFYGDEVQRPTTDGANYDDNKMELDATDSGSEIEMIEVDENWVDANCQCSEDDGGRKICVVDAGCVVKNFQYLGGYCHEDEDCTSKIDLIEVDENWVDSQCKYDENRQENWSEVTEYESFEHVDGKECTERASDDSDGFIQFENRGIEVKDF